MRVTVRRTRREYIYPARHFATSQTDPNLPADGTSVRRTPLRSGSQAFVERHNLR
jgi:hypothetical protein